MHGHSGDNIFGPLPRSRATIRFQSFVGVRQKSLQFLPNIAEHGSILDEQVVHNGLEGDKPYFDEQLYIPEARVFSIQDRGDCWEGRCRC